MVAYSTATLPLLLVVSLLSLAASQTTVVVTVGPVIPSQAPEFVDQDTFTSAILNSTNAYRAEHNASDVRWNATLEDYASGYLAGTCEFRHSGGPYGENLAIGCSNATSCVEAWGDEGRGFDFDDPDFTEETGHFSQLVWKNTTDVGCGRRLCGDSSWYLACEYWPRGNVIGAFGQMVGAPENAGTGRTRPAWSALVVAGVLWCARVSMGA
ncbi:CAP domain-containing protein [Biscogniauxia marginata]|nr:CAP domain-containing protein [Biscogniauxia marginata]